MASVLQTLACVENLSQYGLSMHPFKNDSLQANYSGRLNHWVQMYFSPVITGSPACFDLVSSSPVLDRWVYQIMALPCSGFTYREGMKGKSNQKWLCAYSACMKAPQRLAYHSHNMLNNSQQSSHPPLCHSYSPWLPTTQPQRGLLTSTACWFPFPGLLPWYHIQWHSLPQPWPLLDLPL